MIARALERIAADLRKIAAEIEAGHDIDPQDIHTAARRIDAQVEMIGKGLADV